ncbi:hypothetical protein CCAL9344_03000 [Campylobacter sp. RM9344]|uniref:Uncharacterized protein n=1 Tax=Campylobacter californiensis TaxID=1032243 RepID=A0AAW3ZSG5_9BACT|nr:MULTISPECIES: hypothetical protein [unclassified Campylobacter]MBE2984719.1 hypothetical protein [Campylobacter sp. RM6883]MBE2986909.1 hypothetical protein [Campylobacter sp. RM12919]MBE2987803.1 hypothetical protein [Campylobacter sp. RM12920]MBE2994635.1 hypothetical protein [Campylobacter sp. RM6913]MBE3021499.1 hypothetical protein [Campylobacter sp. 7477a]MBE3029161.1 hypothetical protein [Campylobacter sp. RM9344]
MSESSQNLDKFELALKQYSEILLSCQSQKGLMSCMKCSEFFECETRKNYVDSAYKSMSKSDTDEGGFDF